MRDDVEERYIFPRTLTEQNTLIGIPLDRGYRWTDSTVYRDLLQPESGRFDCQTSVLVCVNPLQKGTSGFLICVLASAGTEQSV